MTKREARQLYLDTGLSIGKLARRCGFALTTLANWVSPGYPERVLPQHISAQLERFSKKGIPTTESVAAALSPTTEAGELRKATANLLVSNMELRLQLLKRQIAVGDFSNLTQYMS